MIAQSQNEALRVVGLAAVEVEAWKPYAAYCLLREQGLRKQALGRLGEFLTGAARWSDEEKIRFVDFLLPFAETVRDADYGPLPFPLMEKLIKPALELWCARESENSNPFRWYGRFYHSKDHLDRALDINPRDDKARTVLIKWGIDALWYDTHHLPDYFIGDYNKSLKLADSLRNHIGQIADDRARKHMTAELIDYAELVENYAE